MKFDSIARYVTVIIASVVLALGMKNIGKTDRSVTVRGLAE